MTDSILLVCATIPLGIVIGFGGAYLWITFAKKKKD
jgi:hypothetical protein